MLTKPNKLKRVSNKLKTSIEQIESIAQQIVEIIFFKGDTVLFQDVSSVSMKHIYHVLENEEWKNFSNFLRSCIYYVSIGVYHFDELWYILIEFHGSLFSFQIGPK